MKLTIKTGDKVKVPLGGLQFEVLNREVGEDHGMSIEVYAESDLDTQLLRFDCFHDDPHYHVPPSAPGQLNIDKEKHGDGLNWSLEKIRDSVVPLIKQAGFTDVAQNLDQAIFSSEWEKIKQACEAAPPPTHERIVELSDEQLKQIRGE